MAVNLPALAPDMVKALTADDFKVAQSLAKAARDLKGLTTPSLEDRTLAGSALQEAARIRKLLWDNDTPDINKAFQLHRSLTAKRAYKVDVFDRMLAAFRNIVALYDRQEAARVAEAKRKLEAEQLAAAEAARKADADHLLKMAAATNDEALLEAAIETERAPIDYLPNIAVETPAIRDGISTTTRKTVQITDLPAFLEYLATWPARDTVVHVKNDMDEDGPALVILQRDLDNLANKGHTFPGTVAHDKSTVRNTGRK